MSRVFVAEEVALGRRVVVKVLEPELAQGLSVERFAREARLAARLQDPRIVPVLTAGTAGDLPYYSMPFVDGETLRARMARATASRELVPLAECASILRDVALALEYAHAHDVVHRDIKPENVLLSGRTAMVADLRIAKAIGAAKGGADRPERPTGTLTQLGVSLGTPAYMPPEQATGDTVDHRAELAAVPLSTPSSVRGSGRSTPISQQAFERPPLRRRHSCIERVTQSSPGWTDSLPWRGTTPGGWPQRVVRSTAPTASRRRFSRARWAHSPWRSAASARRRRIHSSRWSANARS